jgi:hypothetical protein
MLSFHTRISENWQVDAGTTPPRWRREQRPMLSFHTGKSMLAPPHPGGAENSDQCSVSTLASRYWHQPTPVAPRTGSKWLTVGALWLAVAEIARGGGSQIEAGLRGATTRSGMAECVFHDGPGVCHDGAYVFHDGPYVCYDDQCVCHNGQQRVL